MGWDQGADSEEKDIHLGTRSSPGALLRFLDWCEKEWECGVYGLFKRVTHSHKPSI